MQIRCTMVLLPTRDAQRTEVTTLMSEDITSKKSKSKSTLNTFRQQQQQRSPDANTNSQMLAAKSKSQPKKLKLNLNLIMYSGGDIVLSDNAHANLPIKVHTIESADVASTQSLSYPTIPKTVNASSASTLLIRHQASLVLCVHSVLLHVSQAFHTPIMMAPPSTTCEPSVPPVAIAIAGPEMLATNQSTYYIPCAPPKQPARLTWKSDSEDRDVADEKKKYLAYSQSCWPPPMFIILVSLLEIVVSIYDYMTVQLSTTTTDAQLATSWREEEEEEEEQEDERMPFEISIIKTSSLIYRPDRRLEIWRFISYMLLHENWLHLCTNIFIQFVCGLQLELVHGSLRIVIIYLAGIYAGSLGTSIVKSQVYLIGASGGVYALLNANLATILLNYGQMRHFIGQLLQIIITVSCDLFFAFYTKYTNNTKDNYVNSTAVKSVATISYISHLSILLLRWLALSFYLTFTIFAIAFNLINTVTAQMVEEKVGGLKQTILNNLDFSSS